jgi:uncharacterized protein YjbI with pentapeptide repeats
VEADELRDLELERLETGFVLLDISIASAHIEPADAGSGSIKAAHLIDVELGASKLRGLRLLDVLGERIDAANGDWGGGEMRRVRLTGCRLTGLNLAESKIEEVLFRSCKLDYANFRHGKLARVSFEDCEMTGADFQGAAITASRFSGCRLVESDFSRSELSDVDLRGCELAPAGSVLGLAGATIDELQLMELARPLARECGMTVEER